MNGDRVVKVPFRGAHLDGDAKALRHFVGADADNVKTDDALLGAEADELHGRLGLARHDGVVHVVKGRLVDLDVFGTVALARLVLGEADSADRRVRKDHRRDVVIVELVVGHAAVQAVREAAARGDRHGGELGEAAHVAKRVDVRHIGVLPLVGDDVARAGELDARRLKVEALEVGQAADRREHDIRNDLGRELVAVVLEFAVAKRHFQLTSGVALHLLDFGARDALHARVCELVAQVAADDGVERAQHLGVARDKVHLGAERVQHAGELDGDVAGAGDHGAAREVGELKEAVAVDDVLAAGHLELRGVAARRNQKPLGRVLFIVDGNRVRVDERGRAAEHRHLVLVQVGRVDAVQALNVRVARLFQQRPVKRVRLRVLKAVRGGVVKRLRHAGGIPHNLLGHAPDIDARAAEAALLDQRDAGTVRGRTTRRRETTTSTSNNNKVKLTHGAGQGTADERET